MADTKLACNYGYVYTYNNGLREESSQVLEKTAYTVCPMGTSKSGTCYININSNG